MPDTVHENSPSWHSFGRPNILTSQTFRFGCVKFWCQHSEAIQAPSHIRKTEISVDILGYVSPRA